MHDDNNHDDDYVQPEKCDCRSDNRQHPIDEQNKFGSALTSEVGSQRPEAG
jgi:hypothetical protein